MNAAGEQSKLGDKREKARMLKVGQKVVCIDGSPPVAAPGTALQRVIEGPHDSR